MNHFLSGLTQLLPNFLLVSGLFPSSLACITPPDQSYKTTVLMTPPGKGSTVPPVAHQIHFSKVEIQGHSHLVPFSSTPTPHPNSPGQEGLFGFLLLQGIVFIPIPRSWLKLSPVLGMIHPAQISAITPPISSSVSFMKPSFIILVRVDFLSS